MSNNLLNKDKSEQSEAGISPGVIVIGTIVDFDGQGKPLVDFNNSPSKIPLVALSTVALTKRNINRKIALLFTDGDLNQPVIMGLIHNPLDDLLDNVELIPSNSNNPPLKEKSESEMDTSTESILQGNQVCIDGKKVSIEGAEEISFKCGKASITLTSSGKILLRGTYLLNRSTGVNRILGGSVQIN